MTTDSRLYVGSVFHRRLGLRPHRFGYRLFWLLIDLDEIAALDGRLRLFSHNRFNLFTLFDRDRDHGDGRGAPLRAQAEALLAAHGIDIGDGAIRLLCTPRRLGYDFNPLSVYFCHRRDGALAALIYEVHNTFGERHSYVLPADARQSCDKAFFVSPFLPMGLRYEFAVAPPGETIVLSIQANGPDGPALQAGVSGERRNFVDRQLLRLAIRIPIVALKATLAIHWAAARLLAKGVAYFGRERPKEGNASESQTSVRL